MAEQTKVTSNINVRKVMRDKIVNALESTNILNDEELKDILISLTTVGWKQSDGTWRRL